MGKRSGKRLKKGKEGSKRVKQEWQGHQISQENPIFRSYYQMQLGLPEAEFEIFWAHMKERLPVVFRVNQSCPNHLKLCQQLQDPEFLKTTIKLEDVKPNDPNQPTEMPKLVPISWYPSQTVFELSTSKQQFKRSKVLSSLHSYLQKSFDSGLISRQELVSMLPPLYLNVQPDDLILDMCAAPGSKTSQLLELMYSSDRKLTKGGVIANDADYSRAHMLIHQIQRSGTAGIAVINHPGQFMPQLTQIRPQSSFMKSKILFDKVLCDVPCSGDGATRKLPIKWRTWHTSDGMALHPLQLSILIKGINLLKKNGLLVYSTCSLNPIENEAVLAALMAKVEKGLQIVDVHDLYGVKGRRGMLSWRVCTIQTSKSQQGERKTHLNVVQSAQKCQQGSKVRPTMFAPELQKAKQMHLDHSMRVLPHDQNSGGFFIALLRKTNDFEWKYGAKKEVSQKQELEGEGEGEAFVHVGQDEEQADDGKESSDEDEGGSNEDQENLKNNGNKGTSGSHQNNEQPKDTVVSAQEQPPGENKVGLALAEAGRPNKKPKGSKYDDFVNISEQEYQSIANFYGIGPQLRRLLFVRENCGNQRKIVLISEAVQRFLSADKDKRIKLVNMGCIAFEKGKQSFAGHQCLYRLCQEGIHFLMDFITKRKVKVPLEFFKSMINVSALPHERITDQQLRTQISSLIQGAFFIYIEEENDGRILRDALVGQNFKNSFHLMASKEDIASLTARYL